MFFEPLPDQFVEAFYDEEPARRPAKVAEDGPADGYPKRAPRGRGRRR
jgi:hypothetical protein